MVNIIFLHYSPITCVINENTDIVNIKFAFNLVCVYFVITLNFCLNNLYYVRSTSYIAKMFDK